MQRCIYVCIYASASQSAASVISVTARAASPACAAGSSSSRWRSSDTRRLAMPVGNARHDFPTIGLRLDPARLEDGYRRRPPPKNLGRPKSAKLDAPTGPRAPRNELTHLRAGDQFFEVKWVGEGRQWASIFRQPREPAHTPISYPGAYRSSHLNGGRDE